MNTITKTLLSTKYRGTVPPSIFREPFRYALKAYEFILDVGENTLKSLAYRIRELYSLENERNLACVAVLEAEHIWQLYLSKKRFPGLATHSPHVHNNSATYGTSGGMEIKREFIVRCPTCTDVHSKFSGNLEHMHVNLHRSYWSTLKHMQTCKGR